ncbi:hypothetical protein AALP_AAs46356U000100 [Arabis alpina]|uniref:Uncharacterized protein n=1 Tax=Arabis alpina TaxID=50452 RepID=A0A087FWT2_ARAAL|nr:hypothetical protein AALP_AAs46356U000100 [Arabis alpina]
MATTQLKSNAIMDMMKKHLSTNAGKAMTEKIGLVYQIDIALRSRPFYYIQSRELCGLAHPWTVLIRPFIAAHSSLPKPELALRPLLITAWLGYIGGTLALSFSYGLYAILLGSFMCFSSASSKTCAPLSMEMLDDVGEFFRYGLPSVAMVWYFHFSQCLLSQLNASLSS